jgi:hypothetical protein
MSVQSINTSSFFANIAPAAQTQAGGQVSATELASAGAAAESGTSVQGRFLSKLQALEQSDPAQAKQLLSGLANRFRSEAAQGGASSAGKAQLADQLQKAADTGDLTDLLKTAQGGGSGGGWTRGAGAYHQTMAVTRASM